MALDPLRMACDPLPCSSPGIQEPDVTVGFYEPRERPAIARILDRISSALCRQKEMRDEVKRQFVIRNARMPVARITLTCGLVIDLSIGGASGPQVRIYLLRRMREAWELGGSKGDDID